MSIKFNIRKTTLYTLREYQRNWRKDAGLAIWMADNLRFFGTPCVKPKRTMVLVAHLNNLQITCLLNSPKA